MDNRTIISDLKNRLVNRFGEDVERIFLFGSRSNGVNTQYSDFDILIILKTDHDWRREREIYDICYEIDLKYDIIIDAKIISGSELQTLRGKQPYIQEALTSDISI